MWFAENGGTGSEVGKVRGLLRKCIPYNPPGWDDDMMDGYHQKYKKQLSKDMKFRMEDYEEENE